MADTRIDSADDTNMNNINYENTASYTTTNKYTPDASDATSQTEYQMDWSTLNGYYQDIEEYAAAVDKKAMWTVGKGYKADPATTKILKNIRGNGKQTFNTILMNAVIVYTVGGDFYAEIIRNSRGKLVNLKPLNPGTIKIIANDKGIITGYEQFTNTGLQDPQNTFKPKEIFHLPWNPLADSIHGQPNILKMRKTIEARKEATSDMRVVFHRYVKPLWVISVDTDDTAEIAAFKRKMDSTIEKAENLVVPKDTVDKIERVSVPQFSNLDPLPWIKHLETAFIRAEGAPNIVLGVGGDETEAASKILYLAWQQVVEWNQQFIMEQLEAQIDVTIKLEFPASIAPELMADNSKDAKLTNNKTTPGKDNK